MTNLLKIKGADGASETEDGSQSESEQQNNASDCESGQSSGATSATAGGPGVKIQNLQQKMSSGLDKLDSLLAKTENAQNSMAHQNEQIKSFLK